MANATLPETITQVQGTTAVLQLSVPASQGIGSLPLSDIAFYPYGLANQPVSVVPSTEVWRIEDLGINSTITPDIVVGLVVNGIQQPLAVDLNSAVFTNSGRLNPVSPYIDIPANSTFNFTAYLEQANGSTAQTINVLVKMTRIPLSVYLMRSNATAGHLFTL